MKIKVLSDSTCDLPLELIREKNITLVPLNVIKGEENFRDGETITPDRIFAHVAAGGSLCSTAAVSVGDYEEQFARYAGDYDYVVHINIGSGFSACHQNARLAAQEFDNVLPIDSMQLSTGQGLVVLEACRLAEEGVPLAQMRRELEAFSNRVEMSFVLDRLDYMVKGGRCSAAAALGANLLNLKPCIEVKDGKLVVVKKYRGSFCKSIQAYVKDRMENRADLSRKMGFLVYTAAADESIQAARSAMVSCGGFCQLLEATAGCTVSCHCGPGALGLAFLRN